MCSDDSSESGKLQKLYEKGYENLIKQCRDIGNSSLLERLETKWTRNIPIKVHQRCRALFMQKEPGVEHVEEEDEHGPRKKRRVSQVINDGDNKGKKMLLAFTHIILVYSCSLICLDIVRC